MDDETDAKQIGTKNQKSTGKSKNDLINNSLVLLSSVTVGDLGFGEGGSDL
jgi:hypothetical protein